MIIELWHVQTTTFWMMLFLMICFYSFRLHWSGNYPQSHSLSRLVTGSDQIVVVSSPVWRLQACWIRDHLLSPVKHDTECQMSQRNHSTGINKPRDWRQRYLHTVLRRSSGGEELQQWRDHRWSVISNQRSDMCRYSDSEMVLFTNVMKILRC